MRWGSWTWTALFVSSAVAAQMAPGGGGGGGRGGHEGRGGATDSEVGSNRQSPPRPPKPLTRQKFDKVVTAMFRAADANRDGAITLQELQTVIDGRREALIQARFKRIDRNHNGSIDPEEFSAWQRSMGSLALSEADARGASDGPVSEAIEPELGNGPDDRIMERLIEPLNATVLVGANVQYRAGITLDELLAYEHNRFDAADADHDGEVSSDEARAWENSQKHHDRGGTGDRRPPQ